MSDQERKPSSNATKGMRAPSAGAPLDDSDTSPQDLLEIEWRQRAVELHTAFVKDLVEAQDFCPWAKSARHAGRSQIAALWSHELDDFVSDVVNDPEDTSTEVWQLVVLDGTERPMRWRGDVADLELRLRRRGVDLPWALAAFHPQHPGRPESIGGVIGMLRRSPLPAIQLVRLDVLDRVRDRAQERVKTLAEDNLKKMQRWVQEDELVRKHAEWLCQGAELSNEIVVHRASIVP